MSIPLAHSHRAVISLWQYIVRKMERNPLCFPSWRENLDLSVHFALGVRNSYTIFKNQNILEFSIISLSVCFKQMTVQCQAVESWGTEERHKGRGGERAEWVCLCSCVRTTVSACQHTIWLCLDCYIFSNTNWIIVTFAQQHGGLWCCKLALSPKNNTSVWHSKERLLSMAPVTVRANCEGIKGFPEHG